MSLFSTLFGRRRRQVQEDAAARSHAAYGPASGWIRVARGGADDAARAVVAYAENLSPGVPREFRVRIVRHPDGFLAVTFPDGVPPYDWVNLVAWLDAPPEVDTVSGATGFLTSPDSGLRYALRPDPDAGAGDVLVGSDSLGTGVRVYVPEAGMCELSHRSSIPPEPDLAALPAEEGVTLTVRLDVDATFGNPGFRVTHPVDTDWG